MCRCTVAWMCFAVVAIPSFVACLALIGRAHLALTNRPWALMQAHNASDNPATFASRFRAPEYEASRDKNFFQWWNVLVYDAETDDHFTIVYSLVNRPEGSTLADEASVGYIHLRGPNHVNAGSETFPYASLTVSGDFDLEFTRTSSAGTSTVPHKLLARDDGTYVASGSLPGAAVEWELDIRRVHGFYGSEDQEQGNIDGFCATVSTLFGYHSVVTGSITDGNNTYEIGDEGGRFRAYAAGSWGCNLPGGQAHHDPVDYPWSWLWLVMPPSEATGRTEEVAMVWGSGRFGFGFPVGSVFGGYSVVAMGDLQWSLRRSSLFHETPVELLMQGSTSHGTYVDFQVEQSEWATFQDAVGSARLPLRQTFTSRSDELEIVVDCHSSLNQYFRIPAIQEDDIGLTVFSDFRAVGVRTHVLMQRVAEDESRETLVDEWTSKLNALEFAYRAPLDDAAMDTWLAAVRGASEGDAVPAPGSAPSAEHSDELNALYGKKAA